MPPVVVDLNGEVLCAADLALSGYFMVVTAQQTDVDVALVGHMERPGPLPEQKDPIVGHNHLRYGIGMNGELVNPENASLYH